MDEGKGKTEDGNLGRGNKKKQRMKRMHINLENSQWPTMDKVQGKYNIQRQNRKIDSARLKLALNFISKSLDLML